MQNSTAAATTLPQQHTSTASAQQMTVNRSLTLAAWRPACFRTAHTYSVPLLSASLVTSSGATPFFAAKPVSAFVGFPSGPKAACKET